MSLDRPRIRRHHCHVLLAVAGLLLPLLGGCDERAVESVSGTATPAASTAAPAPATRPAAPPTAPVAGGQPQITFAKMNHDFGDIVDTEKYRTSYPFTNTGDAELVISEVKAACGCTVPTLAKRRYAPGEGGEIEIVFDPKGKTGRTPKNITVISNAPGGTEKLTLVATIKPLLQYERMHRLNTLALGQEHRRRLDFYSTDPELVISNITTNNTAITASLVESNVPENDERGQPRYRSTVELVVSPDAPWGLLYATRLNLSAYGRPTPDRDPTSYDYNVYLMGEIFGELSASPSMISISRSRLAANAPFEASTTIIRRTGAPFEIVSASVNESTMPGVEVRTELVTGSSYRVTVYGDTGSFRGSIRGTVLLKTNVPGEELLTIRFSGFVQ